MRLAWYKHLERNHTNKEPFEQIQLPEEHINCLICSIKSRCNDCISVTGHHTTNYSFFMSDSIINFSYLPYSDE